MDVPPAPPGAPAPGDDARPPRGSSRDWGAATLVRPFDWSPLWIALVYAAVGAVWIVGSDAVVLAFVRDEEAITRLQTYKGWFFVVGSACLIFALVRRRVNALNSALAAQRAAARDSERLVAILEATTDLVTIITPDRRLRYLNAAGRRLLGIGPDDRLDRFESGDFLHESEHARREEVLQQATTHGSAEVEWQLQRVDGTPVLVSQVLLVHKDSTGAVEFISSVARDIGEQRRREHALRQAQKMEAVGQLAGGVAHDFNNLLTVILNCGESLAASLPEGDDRREDATEIVKSSLRAARLTRQLLAFSRQQVMEVQRIDINVVIRNLLGMLRRLVGDNVQIVERLDDRTPPVVVDPGQFEQVLVNLIVNARDAMPNGGTVTIRSSDAHVGGKRVAILEVRDMGTGMTEATRARIFEPFFTTKQMGQGTGLGLATVSGIVAQSGGEISVESTAGHGSTFRLQFPAAIDAALPHESGQRPHLRAGSITPDVATKAAEPEPGPKRARAARRVVVVEDQDAVRHLIARMLAADGYEVAQARSAEEAYRFLNDGQDVALVLTDVEMPGVSGRALAEALERHDRRIPVVFMSGHTNDALLVRGSLPPNASFLAKPFTMESLRSAVRQAIDA